MIYFFYIVFFFLILRFTVTLFNFISNPKLTASFKQYQQLVSVLIPARNEVDNIINLLQSIKNQDYKNIEVIVLDDGSDDGTFEKVNDFCKADNRFSIIKGKPLPNKWLGKNYACHQLAEIAKGDYFLFLDADEIIANGLINNAVNRMVVHKIDLLSLFTNQVMQTFGEKTVVPLMHFLLLNLLPLRLVKLSKNSSFAAASGQFMLFNAKNYRQFKWHELVCSQVVEDIEIMRLVKINKLRGEALLANGYIFCRMYPGYKEAVAGFSKNLLAGFGNSVIGLIIYLILVVAGPVLILFYLNLQLFIFSLVLILISRLMVSLLSGQNPVTNILLHPFQIVNLLVISIFSIQKTLSGKITWKGRTIRN